LEENSLKDLNNEYAALIKEYLDITKGRVTGVLLFGSVSRHEEMPFPQSDIDMIVVAKDLPSDFYERAEYVRKIENCPSILQSIWMTEEEFIAQFKAGAGYLLDAIHEGKIIYDTGFLKKIIPQSKQELEAKGIRRVGNAWVWPITRSKGIA
jgi:predicted nucleotidyltransferase